MSAVQSQSPKPTGGESPKHSPRDLSTDDDSCCTAQKAMKIFATLFLTSMIAITVTALIVHFPEAETAMYTVFSVGAFVSLVCFVIAAVKCYQKGSDKENRAFCTTVVKAMQIFAALFFISIVAVSMTSVIIHHPNATTAIYTIFSLTATAGFVGLLVLAVKQCIEDAKRKRDKFYQIESVIPKTGTPQGPAYSTTGAGNPFG